MIKSDSHSTNLASTAQYADMTRVFNLVKNQIVKSFLIECADMAKVFDIIFRFFGILLGKPSSYLHIYIIKQEAIN